MIVRLYLRASTDRQTTTRAAEMCEQFAIGHGAPVTVTYTENASGASLERKELMRLIGEAKRGEVLLVESIDRMTRLNPADWKELSDLLRAKGINVVAVDFPLSHRFMRPMVTTDQITDAAVNGICMMMLDVLAAMAHVDYTKRHQRTAQGRATRIAKDMQLGPDEQHLKGFKGRQEDTARNERIRKHLAKGAYSWIEIMKKEEVSRSTVAKQSAILKAAA
jgi:DNA invertase Pin-like site-specific DNA recombinase